MIHLTLLTLASQLRDVVKEQKKGLGGMETMALNIKQISNSKVNMVICLGKKYFQNFVSFTHLLQNGMNLPTMATGDDYKQLALHFQVLL
ncbi:hypothetical protein N9A58_08170 [Opitutales bacterium]|nr:hypothetical protein [Opitutales bacterium]MDC0363452.1 hypothetical protein [Opitutales bacterium]